ncbi:MAG TPA: hypothetical protein ENI27_06375, partial [bacterium]|nr:hypothetical protein [bacterium]
MVEPAIEPIKQEPTTEGGESTAEIQAAETDGGSAPQEERVTFTPEQQAVMDKRVGEITGKYRGQERETAYYKGLAEGKTAPPPVVEPVTAPVATPLKPADFVTDEYLRGEENPAYWLARETRLEENVERTINTRVKEGLEQGSVEATQKQAGADRRQQVVDYATKNPESDIQGGINRLIQDKALTDAMLDAADGEQFGDVLDFLTRNPAEAQRIAAIPSDGKAGGEIYMIKQKLKLKPQQKVIS